MIGLRHICLAVIPTLAVIGISIGFAQDPSSSSSSSTFQGSSKPSGKSETLPPKEAAKACLRTADEMVRGGYRKEAIALYERARELDPTQQQVCRFLAVLYDDTGMDSQALTEYNHAVRLNPKDADLFNDFGYFYYHRHDMHQAEQWFRAAIALAPHNERAWVNLGMTLGEEGHYQDSFDAFSKVVNVAAAHSNVGMILARHGQREEAERAFRQAIALDPSLKQPRSVLAYLDNAQPHGPQSGSAQASAPTDQRTR